MSEGNQTIVTTDYYRKKSSIWWQQGDINDVYQRWWFQSCRQQRCKEDLLRERSIWKRQQSAKIIRGLVVIGGDGSFAGHRKLSNLGINTAIGFQGEEIDLDVHVQEYTIGLTRLWKPAMEAIDKEHVTHQLHMKMQRDRGYGTWCGISYIMVCVQMEQNVALCRKNIFPSEEKIIYLNIVETENVVKQHIIINAEFGDSMEYGKERRGVKKWVWRRATIAWTSQGLSDLESV